MPEETLQGFRLSPQQKRLWSLGRLLGHRAFSIQAAVEIEGCEDAGALRRALEGLVDRHEILRTSFRRVEGLSSPLQVVEDEGRVELDGEVEAAGEGVGGKERGALDAALEELARRDLDPLRDRPVKLRWRRLSNSTSALLVDASTLCLDAGSIDRLAEDLASLYAAAAGAAHGELQPPIQYADLAQWQNDLLESEETAAGREFWQAHHRPSEDPGTLAFEAPGDPRAFEPGREPVALDPETGARLSEVSEAIGVAESTVLAAVWRAFLGRLLGRRDPVLGVALDGRKYEELEDAVGPLARVVPLQCRAGEGESFAALAARIEPALEDAHRWQEYFSWDAIDGVESDVPRYFPFGLEIRRRNGGRQAAGARFRVLRERGCFERFHLSLQLARKSGSVRGDLAFDARRLRDGYVHCLAGQLASFTRHALSEPETPVDRLSLLGEAERRRLVVDFNAGTPGTTLKKLVHERVAEAARATPEAPAVVCDGVELRYGELAARAERLACGLRRLGVGPGSIVALYLPRSVEIPLALLATLEAGAAYLPLETTLPRKRAGLMLDDACPRLILTTSDLAGELPEGEVPRLTLEEVEADPQAGAGAVDGPPGSGEPGERDLAYLMFTSGSTGRPKAVEVEHAHLARYLDGVVEALDLPPGASHALASSFATDLGHTAVFPALTSGGCLHVLPTETASDADAAAAYCREHAIDCLKIVPSHLRALLDADDEGGVLPVRRLVLGGESSPWALVDRCRSLRPECRVFNHYGPTETTVGVTTYRVNGEAPDDSESLPLGRPLGHAQVYVLDGALEPAAVGQVGEIYVGGGSVARGYRGRPAATAERFLPDPHLGTPGGRLYRTGDLGRHRPDGLLEFRGRSDDQVKIRGFRVELGEIETVLGEHAGVQEAVAVVRGSEPGGSRLLAYAVPSAETCPDVRRILQLNARGALKPQECFELPNGRVVLHYNPNETQFLYREIFEDEIYFQNGIELREGDVVFDAGANVGLFALAVEWKCPGCSFYAFEPVPRLARILERNAELHGLDLRVFDAALADGDEESTFAFYSNLSLISSRYADAEQEREAVRSFLLSERGREEMGTESVDEALLEDILDERLQAETVTCRTTTISEVIRREGLDRIDLLKIDVQKSEMDVLAGIAADDWPKVRQIVAEVHDFEDRLARVEELLRDRGFDVVAVAGTGADGGQGQGHVYAVRPEGRGDAPAPRRFTAGAGWHSPRRLVADLEGFLADALPAPMVPSRVLLLDALPRLPNGKVERQGLPAPETLDPEEDEAFVEPRTPVERKLCELWGEVLKVPRVSVEHSFFRLGGHSLLATQLISRVRSALDVEVPLRTVFEDPTVAGMAEAVERLKREGATVGSGEEEIRPVSRDRRRMQRSSLG